MNDELTERQRRYAENIARGLASRAAAKGAGFSESFSKVAAHRLGKKPAVAKAIEEIRSRGRELAVYDLGTAMAEANAVCAFAKQHKNAMAYCKATELRAKLSGLLVDTVQVVTVDLTSALERAEQRVMNQTPHPVSSDRALPAPIRWRAHIPGDEEDRPADGQVGH